MSQAILCGDDSRQRLREHIPASLPLKKEKKNRNRSNDIGTTAIFLQLFIYRLTAAERLSNS